MVAIGALLFLTACGGDHPTMSNPVVPETPAAAASGDNAPVKAASNSEEFCTIEVTPVNFEVNGNSDIPGYLPQGATLKVRFSRIPDHDGVVHFAAWDRSQDPQKPLASKRDTYKAGEQPFPLNITLPPGMYCDIQFDAACGEMPPDAKYDGRMLISAFYGGTVGCEPKGGPEPTPTPQPTPTPHCDQEVPSFGVRAFTTSTCATPTPTPTRPPHCEDGHGQDNEHGNCVPDPTPTPRSTPTMTPTSTPRPTATPTPRPTSTPVPTCENTPATSSAGQNFVLGNSSSSTETSWVNNNVDPGPYEFWDKDDDFDSHCTTAWFSAKVVLLKAGTQYRYFLNVTSGQQLCSTNNHDISHISKFRCDD
jgi:hypothetical protein